MRKRVNTLFFRLESLICVDENEGGGGLFQPGSPTWKKIPVFPALQPGCAPSGVGERVAVVASVAKFGADFVGAGRSGARNSN